MRNKLRILGVLADLMRYFSVLCLVPIPVALTFDTADVMWAGVAMPRSVLAFAMTALVCFAAGQTLYLATRSIRGQELTEQEAYISVALAWLVMTAVAAIPIRAHVGSSIDAWFEAMSGMTATGATILTQIDSQAPSLLFWRALLQFVAGLGIVVVGVALLARLTHGGSQLLASDIGGGARLRPKLRETAASIWRIYAFLALLVTALYAFSMRYTGIRVPWDQALFDAVVHAFATVSTGGFSSHGESLGYYESVAVEAVAIVFMLAAATSFALWYKAQRKPSALLKDEEWRAYMAFIALGAVATWLLLISVGRAQEHFGGPEALMAWRSGVFSMVSMGTSTGFVTVDHDQWPDLARIMLLVAMFVGGMAGSTAGGIKSLRILLLLKIAQREMRRLLHPRAVIPIRLGRRSIEEQTLLTVIAFFFTYITIWMVGTGFLAAAEPDLELLDASAAAAAAIGNVGPAMGIVGPFNSYAGLGSASKLALSTLMWVGRVEIFSVLLIFTGRRVGR
jgi:trk system potassium uptake protein TrkH